MAGGMHWVFKLVAQCDWPQIKFVSQLGRLGTYAFCDMYFLSCKGRRYNEELFH